MKKQVIYIILIIVVLLGGIFAWNTIESLRRERDILQQNVCALQISNDSIASRAAAFQVTAETLKHSKDSIDMQLREAYKEIGKKDKQIAALQYIAQEFNQRDTLRLRDTIFDRDFKIDTTIQDKYHKLNIVLEYPNVIATNYTVYNELDIAVSREKVYVGGRSNCFLKRLFQKKYNVMVMDVKNQNPNVITTKTKFYEIIK